MDRRAIDMARVWPMHDSHRLHTGQRLIAARGVGPYLIDDNGRRYLDAASGTGSVILGYAERRIADAMTAQLAELPSAPLSLHSHGPAIALANRLRALAPTGMDTVLYTAGGPAGAQIAVRLARHAQEVAGNPGRDTVAYLHGASHAAPDDQVTKGDDHALFYLRAPGALQVPSAYTARARGQSIGATDTLETLRQAVAEYGSDSIAAILIEPVHGAVLLPHRPEVLLGCRELADEIGALLIFDESTTALARTGAMFAAEIYNIRPDILVLGSALTGGYAPLGALLLSARVFEQCRDRTVPSLFGLVHPEAGHPVACAAALAVLGAVSDDGLLDKAVEDGARLRERLRTVADSAVTGTPRGLGLLAALDLFDPVTGKLAPDHFVDAVVKAARGRGVLLRAVDSAVAFAPPLVCSDKDLDYIAETVAESVADALKIGAAPR